MTRDIFAAISHYILIIGCNVYATVLGYNYLTPVVFLIA